MKYLAILCLAATGVANATMLPAESPLSHAILHKITACYPNFARVNGQFPQNAEEVDTEQHDRDALLKWIHTLPPGDTRDTYQGWADYWNWQISLAREELRTHTNARAMDAWKAGLRAQETQSAKVNVPAPPCCKRP